jgi:hypothetical protein
MEASSRIGPGQISSYPRGNVNLRAANYSPKTIASYTTSTQRLYEFLH